MRAPRQMIAGMACLTLLSLACSPDSGDVQRQFSNMKIGDDLVWQNIQTDKPMPPSIVLSGDELVFNLRGFFAGQKVISGDAYSRIVLPEHSPLAYQGMPELPKVKVNLAIPPAGDVHMSVVDAEYYDLPMPPPLPSKGLITRNVNPDSVPYVPGPFYNKGGRFPEETVIASTPFVLRDMTGMSVQFHPFVYDTKKKSLRIFTRIQVHLDGLNAQIGQVRPRPGVTHFENAYRSTFFNYKQVATRYTPIAEPGRMIVIAADAYADAVAPLIAWKNQRGLHTELVKLSQIGSTAADIKSFIKAEFESPASLTYVMLVGDSDTVPTLTGTYESADSDPTMAMVAGDDLYPDLYISRLSARSVDQVNNQVQKFINYERHPEVGGAWYTRAIGVASAEGSPTDKDRCEELRVALEGYGYTSVSKIYDPGASEDTLRNDVNAGVSLINYIGHGSGTSWATTGFNTADAEGLHNGRAQPFIIDVSCMNGSFVDYNSCYAESWLRSGTVDAPAGAISMFSASTSAAWVPPTVMQKWAVNELLVKEQKYTIGGLFFGGSMKVLDDYTYEGDQLVEQYNIFGDASVMVRTKQPKALSVALPETLPVEGTIQVGVDWADGGSVANATVALSVDDQLLAAGQTGIDGAVALSYGELQADVVHVVVTAYNAIPFETDLTTGPPPPQPPVADAGQDTLVKSGSLVTLDGSASSDPNEDPLNYTWTQLWGPTVALSNPAAVQPTFQAPVVQEDTKLVFGLIVNDGTYDSEQAEVTITVLKEGTENIPPTANAGSDLTVSGNVLVTLDGSASSDPEGNPLTFSWTQTEGLSVDLQNANSATPSFVAPNVNGSLTFQLIVNDGEVDSAADSVVVTVDKDNHQPVADAGADISVEAGQSAMLNGSGSTDPDGDALSYLWEQTSGPQVELQVSGATAVFTAPLVVENTTLSFKLTVTDGEATNSDSVTVTVTPIPIDWDVELSATDVPIDIPEPDPVGISSTISVATAGTVSLGEVQVDIDHPYLGALTVELKCPDGKVQVLHEQSGGYADGIHETYTITECVGGQAAGNWELWVADHDAYGDDGDLTGWTLRLLLEGPANQTPTANAGADQEVAAGTVVTLAGSGSDPDGDNLTYSWSQVTGPEVQLNGQATANPSFTAPMVDEPTTLTFSLVVSDGQHQSAADTVDVVVVDANGWHMVKTSADTPISIPDSDPAGIESVIQVDAAGSVTECEVEVHITHPYIGALQVSIQAPDGTTVMLHNHTGYGKDNINAVYQVGDWSTQPMSGTWKLLVNDYDGWNDNGTLDSWTLYLK